MKQNILLAAASRASLIPLLDRLEVLLNNSSQTYFKTFYQDEAFHLNLQLSGGEKEKGIDQLVSKVEHELEVEKHATEHGYKVEILRGMHNNSIIISQSTVADLLIVDLEGFDFQYLSEDVLGLIEKVNCPVLLFPSIEAIQCFVSVHDASQSSVRMIKGFIQLFGSNFRELPLSVFLEDPDDQLMIDRERVFVNYLKLFFKNIGVQHIYEEDISGLLEYIEKECGQPFLVVNENMGKELFKVDDFWNENGLNSPIFIFKD